MQSVYTYLKGRSPQLCPSIYPAGEAPQEHALPLITFELDSDLDEQLLDGGRSELHQAFVTVLCYDASLLTAFALATRVKTALIGYVGSMGDHQARMIIKESEQVAPETIAGLRGVALQFFIAYQ